MGQVRRAARRADQAHPGREVTRRSKAAQAGPSIAPALCLQRRRENAAHISGRWTPSTARACSSPVPVSSSSPSSFPTACSRRYVLNSAASWPEPMAVLLMIVLSFLSAVVCYREYLHIGVGLLPGCPARAAKAAARLVPRAVHARHQSLHAGVGHQAGAGDLASEHRRIPDRLGRNGLSADPDRRRAHHLVRHRAIHDPANSSRSPKPKPSASSRPSSAAKRAVPWTS